MAKYKKGFTLIELLAVIVIIGVIATVSIPSFTAIVENSEKESFVDTTYGVIKAANLYCIENRTDYLVTGRTFTFVDGVETEGILKYDGEAPENGTLEFRNDCEVQIELYSGEYMACKRYLSDDVVVYSTAERTTCPEPVIKTVTYDYLTNGGTSVTKENDTLEQGYEIDLAPTSVKAGYKFLGWSTTINGTPLSSLTMEDQDVTLYAIFKKDTVVTYDYLTNGGISATETSKVVDEGEAVDLTPTAIKNDAYFMGWSTDGSTVLSSLNMGASDITLYAVFKDKTYVSYDFATNGGTSTTGTTVEVLEGDPVNLTPTATKAGYNFMGWSTNGTTVLSSLNMGTSDITLIAVYKIKTFVTYNYASNGGTSTTGTTTEVLEGGAVNLTPTATKAGYTFMGWSTSSSPATTTVLSSLTMGTSDITLYAIYRKTIVITEIDGGGTRTLTSYVYNTTTSATITLDTIRTHTDSCYIGSVVENYNWIPLGWSTSTTANGSYEKSAGGAYTFSSNTTYYAQYKRTIYIQYTGNGGVCTPERQSSLIYHNSQGTTTTAWIITGTTCYRDGHPWLNSLLQVYNPRSETIQSGWGYDLQSCIVQADPIWKY